MARILVIEQDRAAIQQIWELLNGSQHEIIAVAQTRVEAEYWVTNHPIDLALISLTFPRQAEGLLTINGLVRLQVPIIYLDDRTEDLDILNRLTDHAAGYLSAPYHQAALLLAIEGALRGAQTQSRWQQSEELLRLQSERERIILAITQQIHRSLHLHEILTTTVQEVRHLLQSDRVVIYQFAPDWRGSVIAESVHPDCLPMLGREIFDPCLVPERCIFPYLSGYVSNTEDIYQANLSPCYIAVLEQFQVRANLVVPILHEDALWGFLVSQQCTTPRRWQDWEVGLLTHLARQVAIALQQAHLYQQVQALNTHLEEQIRDRTNQLFQAYQFEATLKRITDRVRDSLDESHILQAALEELVHTIGVNTCNAAIYDLERRISTIQYEYSITNTPFQSYNVQMDAFPEGYRQLLQGDCFQFTAPLFPGSEDWVSRLVCPIQDDQGILGDIWLIHDASFAFVEQHIRLVEQVANQCAIAIRQSRLFTAVQAQITALERLNQLKDDFLSTVSHELRTPITSIRIALQMLEISLEQGNTFDPVKVQRYLQILKQECQRESKLINDLLDIARLETSLDPSEIETFNLMDQIQWVAEKFSGQMQQNQQQLCLEFESRLIRLTTRLSYFERLFSELLENACKYSPPGATITVSVQEKGTNPSIVILRVSNSGVEIPSEEIPRIFDRFYRIPSQNPWRYSGTGLGLALVQRLVLLLGAKIDVKSESQLTTFTIQFPNNPLP